MADTQAQLLLITFLVVSTGLWACLVLILPRSLRSLFRYRLWVLRDELVDDVIAKRIPLTDAVRDVLSTMEALIRDSKNVTLGRWLLLPRKSMQVASEYHKGVEAAFSAMTREEQERVSYFRQSVARAVAMRLLIGSPLGWLFSVVFVTAKYSFALNERIKSQLTERLTASSAVHRDGNKPPPLSTCVG